LRPAITGAFLGSVILAWGLTEQGFEEALGDPELLILLWGLGWFAGFRLGYRLSQSLMLRRLLYVLITSVVIIVLASMGGSTRVTLIGYLLATMSVSGGLAATVLLATRGWHGYSTDTALRVSFLMAGIVQLFLGLFLVFLEYAFLALSLLILGLAIVLIVSDTPSLIPPALLDALDRLSSSVAWMKVPRVRNIAIVASLTVVASYSRLWARYACNCDSPWVYSVGGFAFSMAALLSFYYYKGTVSGIIPIIAAITGFLIGEWCSRYVVLSFLTGWYAGLGYVSAYSVNPLRVSSYSFHVSIGVLASIGLALLFASLGLLHVFGLLIVLGVEGSLLLLFFSSD